MQKKIREIFYDDGGQPIKIKGNGGDSSDLTMGMVEPGTTNICGYLAISSKCCENEQSGKLDIEKMHELGKNILREFIKIMKSQSKETPSVST